jgi:RES domain-containing protein
MAVYFRLVQARWADSAMTGEGARLAGGRWNPAGLPAVYLAESRALAALEVLVHAPRELLALDWRIFEVEVPDDRIETADLGRLPGDWRNLPSSVGARRFGEAWLRRGGALALRLPSAIIPEESAILVNPLHRDISRTRVSKPKAFHFDSRLAPG